MINSKEELRFFFDVDKFAWSKKGSPSVFGNEVWKFQIALRKCEYYKGQMGLEKLYKNYFTKESETIVSELHNKNVTLFGYSFKDNLKE